MRYLVSLAIQSAWNRRATLAFTLISIALATTLLLGAAQIRRDLHENFSQAVSGTDLIVGARGSPVQLLLYAVFHIGEATQNMSWTTAQRLAHHPAVAWSIPLSLGDSHHGFPVLATSTDYFTHLRYGHRQTLQVTQGRIFADIFEAVLGADVARRLNYHLGQRITLTHGSVTMPGAEHADKPFTVIGILQPTGTPIDRTVHITLAGMEAIHLDWQGGAPLPGVSIPPQWVRKFDLTPKTITAQLLGLKRRSDVFAMQRTVADETAEPLMGVLPGVTLDQLWSVLGQGEQALMLVSWLVAIVGLGGLMTTILAGLQARRRELAILRAVGARPADILVLLVTEGLVLTLVGIILGVTALACLLPLFAPTVQAHYGLTLATLRLNGEALSLIAAIFTAGCVASLLPGLHAYRLSLADGLMPRI
jgi:putative ABC transport system permease protein